MEAGRKISLLGASFALRPFPEPFQTLLERIYSIYLAWTSAPPPEAQADITYYPPVPDSDSDSTDEREP